MITKRSQYKKAMQLGMQLRHQNQEIKPKTGSSSHGRSKLQPNEEYKA